MTRIRVSAKVDATLISTTRNLRPDLGDGALLDEALGALVGRLEPPGIDLSYAAYDAHPLGEPDEWGDLASFREAAASSWTNRGKTQATAT